MGTKQSTADFILDQLASLKNVAARKMFGEYALYCDDKVVGLLCDETLYLKISEPGKLFIGQEYQEGMPYPGAKPAMKIDKVDDAKWLSTLVQLTADHLPIAKKEKGKRRKK